MREFRTGTFEKHRVAKPLRHFTPAHAVESLHSIDLQSLWDRGKRLLLVDVDNTLVHWHAQECSATVLEWAKKAKAIGFDICIISNTNQLDRLKKIADSIGAETVRGRFKPSRTMFRLALIKFKRNEDQAIMIGDQLMTDVLGANRSGIEAIWVRRLEGKEFKGTSINRFMERLVTGAIYQALVTPLDEKPDNPEVERAKPLAQKTLVHQFIKFSIVGSTSFTLDYCFTYLLIKIVRFNGDLLSVHVGRFFQDTMHPLFYWAKGPTEASAPILGSIVALVVMFYSFVVNRAWTFEVKGKAERAAQMRRFYVVAIIGQLINVGIFSLLFNIIGNHQLVIPKVTAAGIALVWNFGSQRLYAFRSRD